MASNGIMTGNSDYSYTPAGWTCQVLTNTATVNLGYDVKAPTAAIEGKPADKLPRNKDGSPSRSRMTDKQKAAVDKPAIKHEAGPELVHFDEPASPFDKVRDIVSNVGELMDDAAHDATKPADK